MQSAIVVVVFSEKNMSSLKKRESRRRQRQSGAAENRTAGLSARRRDVGLTLRHRRHRGQQNLYSSIIV